ncbi:hypothetical protein ES703_125519 [subsurface metagenome]
MRVNPLVYASQDGIFLQHLLDASLGEALSVTIHKQGATLFLTHKLRSALIEVSSESLGCRLTYQHHPLLGTFPPDADFISVEVNLPHIQIRQLAHPDTGGIKQLH